jgi:hypothetical protein
VQRLIFSSTPLPANNTRNHPKSWEWKRKIFEIKMKLESIGSSQPVSQPDFEKKPRSLIRAKNDRKYFFDETSFFLL